jgi:hypothetical protein
MVAIADKSIAAANGKHKILLAILSEIGIHSPLENSTVFNDG